MRHSYLRSPTSNSRMHYTRIRCIHYINYIRWSIYTISTISIHIPVYTISVGPTPNALLRIASCTTPNALLRIARCLTPNVLLRISELYLAQILYGARLRVKTLLRSVQSNANGKRLQWLDYMKTNHFKTLLNVFSITYTYSNCLVYRLFYYCKIS